ncbi:hypothetical protein [Thermococcus nautili]|uniref:hypothetical protein n=1 Tax=Thermococcus nautili TaxID=195522 RepID=UPI0012EBB9A9|nr:hypothetical protein [Thermococcus nautili]
MSVLRSKRAKNSRALTKSKFIQGLTPKLLEIVSNSYRRPSDAFKERKSSQKGANPIETPSKPALPKKHLTFRQRLHRKLLKKASPKVSSSCSRAQVEQILLTKSRILNREHIQRTPTKEGLLSS